MKKLHFLVVAIQILSFFVSALVAIAGVVYEISPVVFEQLMTAVGISDGLRCIWVASSISTGVMLITYFVRKRYFD